MSKTEGSGSTEALLGKPEALIPLPACPAPFQPFSFQSQTTKAEPTWTPPRCGGKTENSSTKLPSKLCRSHLDFKLSKRLKCFVFLSTWKWAVLICWYQKRKTLQNYWPSSYRSLFIYHLLSSATAPEKPLVQSLNSVERGFNSREKYGDNADSQVACCYLTSWYGKLKDLAICSPPSLVCCLRAELAWITCWRRICMLVR